jgi:hypothetical protein
MVMLILIFTAALLHRKVPLACNISSVTYTNPYNKKDIIVCMSDIMRPVQFVLKDEIKQLDLVFFSL